MDFKNLKFQPTSCWVRLFDTLTAVLPLAFRLQMLHFTYKTCISFTNRALSRYEPIGVIIYANASFMEIPMEIIQYGDPDNSGKDLKGYGQIYIRAEVYLGWGILVPEWFARIKEA